MNYNIISMSYKRLRGSNSLSYNSPAIELCSEKVNVKVVFET